jgi:hypothetical protein
MGVGTGPTPTPTYGLTSGEQSVVNQYTSTQSTGVTGGTGQVYMGTQFQMNNTMTRGGMGHAGDQELARPDNSPYWMTLENAKAFFGTFNQNTVNALVAQGVMAGLLKPGDGWVQAQDMWNKLVTTAATVGASGQQVSPMDILKSYITNQQSAGSWVTSKDGLFQTNALTGARRYVGPQFRTTTATAVNLTDPATAQATATSIFQQLLGRDPLPGELTAYSSALQQAEQANPTVITTTNQYDDQGNVIATTKQDQKGGYSADAQKFLAEQQVKAKPEYGATQAATTYENAFESAVFGAPR